MTASSVKLALDLLRLPSRLQWQQREPLPRDIVDVLSIAAGDETVLREAALTHGQTPETVKAAAGFFIEQIVLVSGGDSYRVLAATPQASSADLRRNMALLLRWLHPDREANRNRALYAARVTSAWEDLKTVERRAAYDAQHMAVRSQSLNGTSTKTSKLKLRQRLQRARIDEALRKQAGSGPRPRRRRPGLLKRAYLALAERFGF